MKKQKKQNLLTAIIIIALFALAMMITSMIYEEKINSEKAQNVISTVAQDDEKNENTVEEDNTIKNETVEEPVTEPEQEYVGEEEQESSQEEITTQSKDEKAIELAKKEWGEDDSATFSIEEKNNSKYYVAVRKDGNTLVWYEVDTETWEISEY